MFVIFTDTDTDTTPEIAKKYDYKLISMPYFINEKEVHPYEDFDKFEPHTYYDMLRKGVMPKTGGLSPQTYIDYFEPYFKDGYDILYVHFSKAMSSTFNSMQIAIDELKETYPERKLYTIDTKAITTLSLPIVELVGKLYKEVKAVEEIIDIATKEVDKWTIYFFVDDLSFFRRSGRVSAPAAIMGNLIGICPIIYMSSEGVMTSVDKARGRKNVINKVLGYVEKLEDNIKDYTVYIGHSDALETARYVGTLLKQKYGEDLNIYYSDVNPTAGAHCGPGGVGVCFHAKSRK